MRDHVQIVRDRLIVDNGEEYTLQELRYLRWELIQYRRLTEALQRDLKKSGMENAVLFATDELRQIRAALRLLDDKLPGRKIDAAAA